VTAPRDVLDAHSALYDRLRFPPGPVVQFFADFFTEEALRQMEGNGELLSRWLQMFAPVRSAPGFLEMVRRPLYGAPTYQVSAGIVDAVTATYEATYDKIAHLEPGDLPSETGFAYLDKSLVLRDAGGYSIATRALSWGPQYISEDFADGAWPDYGDSGTGRRGVRLTSWCHIDDADSTTVPDMAERLRAWGMALSLSHSAFVPFDVRMGQRGKDDDVTADDITRWAHTLWMFMGTEIVATAWPQVERPSRRRGTRLAGVSAVNVVTLRRVRTAEGDCEPRDVDWSCRWVVQAHYRHLDDYSAVTGPHHAVPLDGDKEHCAVCRTRVTRIRAYVKGPDGLPLKPVPETVYRVAR
jgi:hypothetical protein